MGGEPPKQKDNCMQRTQVVILGLLLLTWPAAVEAQLTYTTNADGVSLTITSYKGSGANAVIPTNINGLTVNDIGSKAFAAAFNLVSVTIPDTVTNIGEDAFFGCISLTSMTIPDSVVNIGESAFFDCNILANVTIPDSVTNIGESAFLGCTSLANVTIPNSVTNIGESAFFGDGSLSNVFIGNIVSRLEQGTFATCHLTSVTILMGATGIAESAFQGCSSLTNVTIPNSVIAIGEAAFSGCGLKNLNIPNQVTTIEEVTFCNCTTLTNVTIPQTVTNIRNGAFAVCGNLASVFFMGNDPTAGTQIFNEEDDKPDPVIVYYLPGTTGWDEFSAAAEVPVVLWNPLIQTGGSNFGVNGNQFGFNITGTTNIPIVVEASTNLANPVWTRLQSLSVTNALVYFSDAQWTNYPARYYRITAPCPVPRNNKGSSKGICKDIKAAGQTHIIAYFPLKEREELGEADPASSLHPHVEFGQWGRTFTSNVCRGLRWWVRHQIMQRDRVRRCKWPLGSANPKHCAFSPKLSAELSRD